MRRARKVLVIDSDDDLRSAVGEHITALGVEAVHARDEVEALRQVADGSAPPDAILIDVLPAPSCRRFITALRADPRLADIPIITVTAGEGAQVASRLPRPFDLEELARILVSLCG